METSLALPLGSIESPLVQAPSREQPLCFPLFDTRRTVQMLLEVSIMHANIHSLL
jgi:hypothetical protein